MEIVTESEKETKRMAGEIAEMVKKKGHPLNMGLRGELGSGKTTFVKGFAEKFGLEEITSPTFVIMKKYEIEGRFEHFYHVDCYRIEEKSDLSEINFNSVLKNSKSVVLVEWPERLTDFPTEGEIIEFEFVSENERRIKIPETLGLNKSNF